MTNVKPIKFCHYCGATSTPMWRHGPGKYRDLCNSCGVKYRRGRIIVGEPDDPNDPNAVSPATPAIAAANCAAIAATMAAQAQANGITINPPKIVRKPFQKTKKQSNNVIIMKNKDINDVDKEREKDKDKEKENQHYSLRNHNNHLNYNKLNGMVTRGSLNSDDHKLKRTRAATAAFNAANNDNKENIDKIKTRSRTANPKYIQDSLDDTNNNNTNSNSHNNSFSHNSYSNSNSKKNNHNPNHKKFKNNNHNHNNISPKNNKINHSLVDKAMVKLGLINNVNNKTSEESFLHRINKFILEKTKLYGGTPDITEDDINQIEYEIKLNNQQQQENLEKQKQKQINNNQLEQQNIGTKIKNLVGSFVRDSVYGNNNHHLKDEYDDDEEEEVEVEEEYFKSPGSERYNTRHAGHYKDYKAISNNGFGSVTSKKNEYFDKFSMNNNHSNNSNGNNKVKNQNNKDQLTQILSTMGISGLALSHHRNGIQDLASCSLQQLITNYKEKLQKENENSNDNDNTNDNKKIENEIKKLNIPDFKSRTDEFAYWFSKTKVSLYDLLDILDNNKGKKYSNYNNKLKRKRWNSVYENEIINLNNNLNSNHSDLINEPLNRRRKFASVDELMKYSDLYNNSNMDIDIMNILLNNHNHNNIYNDDEIIENLINQNNNIEEDISNMEEEIEENNNIMSIFCSSNKKALLLSSYNKNQNNSNPKSIINKDEEERIKRSLEYIRIKNNEDNNKINHQIKKSNNINLLGLINQNSISQSDDNNDNNKSLNFAAHLCSDDDPFLAKLISTPTPISTPISLTMSNENNNINNNNLIINNVNNENINNHNNNKEDMRSIFNTSSSLPIPNSPKLTTSLSSSSSISSASTTSPIKIDSLNIIDNNNNINHLRTLSSSSSNTIISSENNNNNNNGMTENKLMDLSFDESGICLNMPKSLNLEFSRLYSNPNLLNESLSNSSNTTTSNSNLDSDAINIPHFDILNSNKLNIYQNDNQSKNNQNENENMEQELDIKNINDNNIINVKNNMDLITDKFNEKKVAVVLKEAEQKTCGKELWHELKNKERTKFEISNDIIVMHDNNNDKINNNEDDEKLCEELGIKKELRIVKGVIKINCSNLHTVVRINKNINNQNNKNYLPSENITLIPINDNSLCNVCIENKLKEQQHNELEEEKIEDKPKELEGINDIISKSSSSSSSSSNTTNNSSTTINNQDNHNISNSDSDESIKSNKSSPILGRSICESPDAADIPNQINNSISNKNKPNQEIGILKDLMNIENSNHIESMDDNLIKQKGIKDEPTPIQSPKLNINDINNKLKINTLINNSVNNNININSNGILGKDNLVVESPIISTSTSNSNLTDLIEEKENVFEFDLEKIPFDVFKQAISFMQSNIRID